MKTPPISEQELQPKIISNIQYVNGIEEMEKIELKLNEIALRFDNNVYCFYTRSRDKHGEYSPVNIYFYDDFVTKMQNIENWEFTEKCKALKFDALKTELAVKFFINNEKLQDVLTWIIEEKKHYIEYDSLKSLKYKIKIALYGKVTKK